MKKYFLSALVLAGSVLLGAGCSNGDYDATPNANNSNIPNPFLNNGGGGGGKNEFVLGKMSAMINGKLLSVNAAGADSLGLFYVYGSTTGTPMESMSIMILDWKGKKQYVTNDTTMELGFSYVRQGGSDNAIYGVNIGIGKGHVQVDVTDDADNKVKGTFEGVIYNVTTGSANASDSMVVTEGKFWINK